MSTGTEHVIETLKHEIEMDIKEKLLKAVLGGFVGTFVFTLMGMYLAPIVLGHPMDTAKMLAPVLGGVYALGMLVHFTLGSVVFPVTYLVAVFHRIPGPSIVRGIFMGVALWTVAMIIVMPILGHPMFMGAMPPALMSLAGHIVYGFFLGLITGKPGKN